MSSQAFTQGRNEVGGLIGCFYVVALGLVFKQERVLHLEGFDVIPCLNLFH